MSLWIGENLEVQPKTNTQKIFPNWVYGWLREVSFAVENKIGNLNKIRLFKVNKWDIPLPQADGNLIFLMNNLVFLTQADNV